MDHAAAESAPNRSPPGSLREDVAAREIRPARSCGPDGAPARPCVDPWRRVATVGTG